MRRHPTAPDIKQIAERSAPTRMRGFVRPLVVTGQSLRREVLVRIQGDLNGCLELRVWRHSGKQFSAYDRAGVPFIPFALASARSASKGLAYCIDPGGTDHRLWWRGRRGLGLRDTRLASASS